MAGERHCTTCDGTGSVAGGERGEVMEPCPCCSEKVVPLRKNKPVFLQFKGQNVDEEGLTFATCKACRNKTFVLVYDKPSSENFPMLRCAACGCQIGRMGWHHDDPPQTPDAA